MYVNIVHVYILGNVHVHSLLIVATNVMYIYIYMCVYSIYCICTMYIAGNYGKVFNLAIWQLCRKFPLTSLNIFMNDAIAHSHYVHVATKRMRLRQLGYQIYNLRTA